MPNYYQDVLGNLNMGDTAKSSDIHHIQRHIKDALKALLSDLHDGESYILGSDEVYKNSFILKAAPKELGRYIDSKNIFDIDETKYLKINQYDVRQPLLKTKTSLYSVVAKFRNTSDYDIPIRCHIEDEYGTIQRSNTVILAKNTPSANYEIVFDLDFYPTPPNLDFNDLIKRDGKDIPPKTHEESFDEGYEEEHDSEYPDKLYFSAGVSKLYFVIERVNMNATDLAENGDEDKTFDAETSLGVYYQEGSLFPDKNMFAETNGNKGTENYVLTNGNIYYQDIYANETTYLCSGGRAIIGGEKITCLDTHISVEGASTIGNVLTQIYLDNSGHLRAANKKASLTTNIDSFKEDIDDPMPPAYLPIGLILTYFNAQYGTAKEPLIIQDSHEQLPRSHHERLRRLEKKVNWNEEISLPSRIKYTLSDDDWIDTSGESLIDLPHTKGNDSKDVETLSNENIFLTTDENGNIVVKLTDAVTQTIPVTLKEKLKDSDGTEIKLEETDVLNVSSFSTIQHMAHDSTKGTLTLEKEKTSTKDSSKDSSNSNSDKSSSSDEKNLTEFDPWSSTEENKPTGTDYEKNEREYKVVSGKNGAHDNVSSYPGMTFYLKSNYNFKKLTIPIHKFKNCSSVKFYIWKRQEQNIKTNSVPYFKKQQLVYRGKDLSLKKAKEKDGYQYMDEGFTLDFGGSGLSLNKGQYVVVAVPTPKSGTGSLFVETYKPKNSRDICIKYVGAANASHFDLTEIYQEVWYNSASALATEEKYYTEGNVVSKTLTWTDKTLEKIKTVKPVINEHLSLGNKDKDSYELYVSTGGKWIKMTPNKDNTINEGGARTFKWKLVFKGDGKSTPKLEYNKKDGFAIKFILTREKAGSFVDLEAATDYDKNMCITSKDFDGDNILREYIGDMNFATEHSRFEGYEFARIWADNNLNDKLSIDIQASDKKNNYKLEDSKGKVYSGDVDLWSLHYCDLTLDDFSKISVDYSDYASEIEYDENNMRLKLDSNHSYNDNDIQILALKDFVKTPNDIDTTEEDTLIFSNNEAVTENQLFMKKTFENPIDLTKYTGLKFKFKLDGKKTSSTILDGLGIYISSAEEKDVPSDKKNKPENLYETPLKDTAIIPEEIDPDTSSYSYYEGQLIEIIHEIDTEKDGNKAYSTGYYQYIKHFDESKNKYIYKLEQVFDLRSYNIYKVGTVEYFDDNNEFEVRIELDQDSNNLKHVKEIGIISLNDESIYNVEETSIATKLVATSDECGTIEVQLVDKDDNPLPNKIVKVDNVEYTTSNRSGSVYIDNLTGEGDINFEFEGVAVEKDDETTVYSKSTLAVHYDFTDEGFGDLVEQTVSYDTNIQADYTKNTSLTVSSSERKKLKITLKDESGNKLKGKKIKCDSTTLTTNDNGEVTHTVEGKGTVTIIYNAEVVTDSNDKKTLYKPSGGKVSYNFNSLKDRITSEGQDGIYANSIKLTLNSVRAVSEECLKIYDPKEAGDDTKLQLKIGPDVSGIIINPYNKIALNNTTYASMASDSEVPDIKELTPNATQININHKNDTLSHGEKVICYINNPFKGGLSKYKHLGIQLATDVYIPKDCLKVNVCAGVNGTDPVASVNIPTMNSIYYPNQAGNKINLSQVFKKIDIDDTQIKSISISITSHFYSFVNNIVQENKPAINVFLGKIVLYRAETIPIYHNKMRFKFYSTTNGEIDHSGKQISTDTISIRKIGAVLDYD